MLKQNDKRLNTKIQAYGCNFLAHLAMVRKNWLPEEIETCYKQALSQGIIDANCTLKQPQALLAMLATPIRQIGGVVLANGESWGVAERDPNVTYRIARWSQRNSRHQHFTLCNANGELYDPYDATIATYPLEKEQLLGYQFYG